MTESCSCITAHPPDKYDYKYAHSGGAIVANTEVKIIKEDGAEANVGEPGEIQARGPRSSWDIWTTRKRHARRPTLTVDCIPGTKVPLIRRV